MTGIERLRFYAGGGELLGRDVAREVVAHIDALEAALNPVLSVVGRDVVAAGELIVEAFDSREENQRLRELRFADAARAQKRIDAQDQRIRELEAGLAELREWVSTDINASGARYGPILKRTRDLLAPAPLWPSISKGVT